MTRGRRVPLSSPRCVPEGSGMPELRISDIPRLPHGGRRVEVTWQDGPARRAATIENLAGSLGSLGDVLYDQDDPGCRPHYQEALALNERIGDRSAQAQWAGSLGNADLYLPERP